jgi:D-3-phosphoglycerate dehydrogenase
MKIAILDDYQDVVKSLDCFALLKGFEVKVFTRSFQSESELAAALQDYEGLVLIRERTAITRSLLAALPGLKVISQTGKVSRHIDLQACHDQGVMVVEGAGSPVAPAELCWASIMAASRHLVPYVENFRQDRWQDSGTLGLGRALAGLTLGIWGYGKIGQRIARYARAFEMNVLVWGRQPSRDKARADGLQAASSQVDFFSAADILTLHLRLVPQTQRCVTAADLGRMKPSALFVNTSRAELVEKDALQRALRAGRPGFAAVDVYEHEPVSAAEEPLLHMPNVLCTPHLGYVEKKSYALYFRLAFENIVSTLNGQPQNLVKP